MTIEKPHPKTQARLDIPWFRREPRQAVSHYPLQDLRSTVHRDLVSFQLLADKAHHTSAKTSRQGMSKLYSVSPTTRWALMRTPGPMVELKDTLFM